MAKIDKRINTEINKVSEVYSKYFPKWELTEQFKKTSVKTFIEKLNVFEVIDSIEKACYKIKDDSQVIKYFCGICWNKINKNE